MVMQVEGQFPKEQIQGDMIPQRICTELEGIPANMDGPAIQSLK